MRHLCTIWLLLLYVQYVSGQGYGSVIVTEIMANPNPPAGLPGVEYLEIFNRTAAPIRLENWTLNVGTRSARMPDSLLLPGAYAVLVHQRDLPALSMAKKLIGLSSLSLPNDGAQVSLFNRSNAAIFSVWYSSVNWPTNKRTGYSLEMVDMDKYCAAQSNWRVTNSTAGGTPGEPNSVAAAVDVEKFGTEYVSVSGVNTVQVVFNQSLDSVQTAARVNILIEGEQLDGWQLEQADFRILTLSLGRAMSPGKRYDLVLENLQTCTGVAARLVTSFGLPNKTDSSDIVINEVLFNPTEDGVDYVELYNRSSKYLNLKNTTLSGSSGASRVITTTDYVLRPGSYVVLTTDASAVKRLYPYPYNRNFIAMSSLPSFQNTGGAVRFSDAGGHTIDSFTYTEAMHLDLIANSKGVSLERIDSKVSAADTQNWQSASGASHFGTPGYVNSQSMETNESKKLHIWPDVIVDGSSGIEAEATINFSTQTAGAMGSLIVYDVRGNRIRKLLDNTLLGTAGSVSWDGKRDSGSFVQTGLYLLILEYYDRQGKRQVVKGEVAVAGRD